MLRSDFTSAGFANLRDTKCILIINYCDELKYLVNITKRTETYFQLRSRSVK